MPEVVVAGEDLAGGHLPRGDVGDVALQSGQASSTVEGGLVQRLGSVLRGDEPGCSGRAFAGDDCSGAVLLEREGVPVASGALAGVGPDRSPGLRVDRWVPDRFDLLARIVGGAGRGCVDASGDGVDDLPVRESVTVPAEVRGQISGCLGGPGADDEPQSGLIQVLEVGG